MAEVAGPRPPSTSTRAPNAHRVHSSCDRCRSRKTKCIDPIPGPCRYCARTGATCTIATPRRKRPYYHVTEEEYQLSMSILQRVFPDQELNLQSLRALSKGIKDGSLALPTVQHAESFFTHESPEDDDGYQSADTPTEWVDALHEHVGSMMKDSKGVYRYVGAQSDIPFNGAVANFRQTREKPDIIPAAKVGHYPPKKECAQEDFYLPPRHLCDIYVKRYLEEVHCMYWLYPEDSLLQRVEDTYSWYSPPLNHGMIKHEHGSVPTPLPRRGPLPSSSWMCSLYAICAIGAANYTGRTDCSPSPGSPTDSVRKTSEDYIALAKQLKPKVEDEADIDSIRALAIMAIALENFLSRVNAYLYIGGAIQMAYTLGLHRDQRPMSGTEVEREEHRRIWWTLFTLDLEIGMRGGSPTIVDERYVKITTALPHEQIQLPGLHTPPGWLSTFVSLSRLKREVIQAIYTERHSNSISFSTVSNLLLLLQKWYRTMPTPLKLDARVPPPDSYKRAVSVLHLHYWSTLILLTRSFLLNLVLKHTILAPSSKIGYERMAKVCIDAAQKSVELFREMDAEQKPERIISSLTTFDSTTLLRCVTIFMCAFVYTQDVQYKKATDKCLEIAHRMEQIGFAEMVTRETPIHLEHLGMGSKETFVLDDQVLAQMWGLDPNFLTPLQTQQAMEINFDDPDALSFNTEVLAFTNLNDSINVFHPSQQYPDFDLRR